MIKRLEVRLDASETHMVDESSNIDKLIEKMNQCLMDTNLVLIGLKELKLKSYLDSNGPCKYEVMAYYQIN